MGEHALKTKRRPGATGGRDDHRHAAAELHDRWRTARGFEMRRDGARQGPTGAAVGQLRRTLNGGPRVSALAQLSRSLQAKFPVQCERGAGKRVLDFLTAPTWRAVGSATNRGKEAVTGQELRILVEGAVEAAWKTYAYHATRSANVASITRHGLDPRLGGTGAAAGNETFAEHSRGHVHYTRKMGTAEAYQEHFEGRSPFGREVAHPEQAEVLQIAIPRDVAQNEEVDPDSRQSDAAYRTSQAIPGANIRGTAPVPLPTSRGPRAGPLQPGAQSAVWKDHVLRGFAETGALLSHMPTSATSVLYDMVKERGLDLMTVLQLVKQALLSMPADEILAMTPTNRARNPRVYHDLVDATGRHLPP